MGQALNQSRNGFSHTAAQSEAQAREWVNECYADVIDALDDLRGLAETKLVRYMDQPNGKTVRCERYAGHGFTRTIQHLNLTTAQVRASERYFEQDQILVSCGESVFGLRPMVYYREDLSGHFTKLCLFRKTRGDAPDRLIEYEVVGEAKRWERKRDLFTAELNELRALFGLGPD